MKFTKQNVEKFNEEAAENSLLKDVTDFVLDKWNEYDDPKDIVTYTLEHGCISGCVSHLIYYSNTTKYYVEHRDEINRLLYEAMDIFGDHDLTQIFCGQVSWDEKDPLALDYYNQNILAWFGFEETMRNFALQFEELEELV